MVYKCCVPQCTSNKEIPLHVFPKDLRRRENWLRAIQRIDLIGKFTELTAFLKNLMYICPTLSLGIHTHTLTTYYIRILTNIW